VSTYHYIAQHQAQVPVRQLYQTLCMSASSYYAWQRRQLPTIGSAWQVAVSAAFRWHSARYGTRRLRAELHAQGYRVAGVSGGRWPQRACAQQPRAFAPRTTDSNPNVRVATNLLLGPPAPNQV
jgi:hypothetical protein